MLVLPVSAWVVCTLLCGAETCAVVQLLGLGWVLEIPSHQASASTRPATASRKLASRRYRSGPWSDYVPTRYKRERLW